MPESYDLIAIGSGPAGRRAAVEAARLGKRAAVVELAGSLGGTSRNFGTLPSKILRAAVLELAPRSRGVYGARAEREITVDDLLWRAQPAIEREREVALDQLRRSRVDVLRGAARFVDPFTIEVGEPTGASYRAASFVVAVGTKPARPAGIHLGDRAILDSYGILGLQRMPRTLAVVGGGVVGLEFASIFAALGVRVTLVEKESQILDAVDREIVEAFLYHLGGIGVDLRLGTEVASVLPGRAKGASVAMTDGKPLSADVVLWAAGHRGATDELGLAAAGVEVESCGRIAVDTSYRTSQPHIFAAGAITGSPGVAAAEEQGRRAALVALEQPPAPEAPLPHGVYTIPEIAFVGEGEQELAAARVPHVVGAAAYRDLLWGQMVGERVGLLKLAVHAETRRVLGVHIFGTAATELVHVGQAVMAGGLAVDYLADVAFNVPSFGDAYRLAAADAVARLDGFPRDARRAA